MPKVKKVKTNWDSVHEKIKGTEKAILLKVIMVDGHTIYDPKKFLDAGLDVEIVEAYTEDMASGEGKEAIYDNAGQLVKKMKGVHGLRVLESIASSFDVTSWKTG